MNRFHDRVVSHSACELCQWILVNDGFQIAQSAKIRPRVKQLSAEDTHGARIPVAVERLTAVAVVLLAPSTGTLTVQALGEHRCAKHEMLCIVSLWVEWSDGDPGAAIPTVDDNIMDRTKCRV